MKTFTFGLFAALALVACQTERDQAGEAVQDLREEEQEARQEVGREVQEGREEVAEARQNLAEELRNMERSGEPVEFDAVVVGSDPDTVNLRLQNGETFDVDYAPTIQANRGAEVIGITELQPGTVVHVTYRYVDGKRLVDTIRVDEGAQMPAGQVPTPNTEDNLGTPGGGTR